MRAFSLFIIGLLLVAAFILVQMPVKAASNSTEEFVQKASVATNFEILSSKLALEKSSNPDIKKFAQQMIDDHTKAGNQMKSALHNSHLKAEANETGLDPRHQAVYDALNQATAGADFDRQYVNAQKKAHEEAVALFESYARVGQNNALQEFAKETLPTLQKHQAHAIKLQKQI